MSQSPSSKSKFRIQGYELHELIGEGSKGHVYRCEKEGNQYAIKILKAAAGRVSLEETQLFQREAAAIARLDHPNLTRVYDFGECDGQLFIVMELAQGVSMADHLTKGPYSYEEAIRIGSSVAGALVAVHSHGLIHQDIKPENIIVSNKGGVKLIDFGLGRNATEDQSSARQHQEFQGTLNYAAPEQVGVIKRLIDERIDLYALGVTLYQAITGRLPIDGATANDLLVALATRVPAPVIDLKPQVPKVVSQIISKLLSKDPDDRYQSASGLKYDLDHALDLLELGTRDLTSSRSYQAPLFGRDEEMGKLREQYRLALKGQGRIVLVHGDGGSGKSRLTREIYLEARDAGISAMSAKCSQVEMDKPMAAFQQALDKFILDLSGESDQIQGQIKEKVRSAAFGRETTLSSISEGLASVISGGQRDVSSDRLRFLSQTAEFLCELSNHLGGLVLIMDDIQWLDEASRSLIGALSQRVSESKILLLASCRDDASSVDALEHFKKVAGGAVALSLPVVPLSMAATHQLIKNFLGGREVSSAIVDRITALADGNPFILNEHLNSLLSSGAIKIENSVWDLDQQSLSSVALSKNVYELVLSRMRNLPDEVRSMLTVVALLGANFDLNTMVKVVRKSSEEVRDLIGIAIRHRIIEQVESGRFSIIHDRIREALILDLSDEERRAIHDQLADILESEVEDNPDRVYALARHSALGYVDRNPLRAFDSNIKAAERALMAFASHDANGFAEVAMGLIGQISLPTQVEYDFWRLIGSIKAAIGRYGEAKELLYRAISKSQTKLDLAQVHFQLGQVQMNEGNYDDSFASLKLSLRKCGYRYPTSALAVVWHVILFLGFGYFVHVTGWGYGILKSTKRAGWRDRYNLMLSNFEIMGILTYLQAMTGDYILSGVAANYYSHFIGDSVSSIRGQIYMANLMATLGQKRLSTYHLGVARQMAERINSNGIKIWTKKLSSMAYMFQGDMAKSLAITEETISTMLRQASPLDIALHAGDHVFQLQMLGRLEESLDLIMKYIPKVDEVKVTMVMWSLRSMASFALHMLGRTSEAVKIFNEAESIRSSLGHDLPFISCRSFGNRFVQRFEDGELTEELNELIDSFESYRLKDYHSRSYYFYEAYIRGWQAQSARSDEDKEKYLTLYKKIVAANERRAVTSLWKSHHATSKAGLHRMLGQFARAEQILKVGSVYAREINSGTVDYYMLKEKARVAFGQGLTFDGRNYLQQAYEICWDRGWVVRERRLREEFSGYPVIERAQTASPALHSMSSGGLGEDRTVNALLRVSLAASLELSLEGQVQSVLNELIAVVGAERGYVFLTGGDRADLRFAGGRSSSGEVLVEPKGFSATVVRKVSQSSEALVVAGSDEMEAIGSRSAVLSGLRSIMAVPLLFKGEARGVVYVDSSLAKGLFSKDDVDVFSAIANHIAIAFENARVMSVEAAKREMQKDLELSAAVQHMLLPKTSSVRFDHFSLAGFYRSAVQCGGDWWWYQKRPDGKLWMFVGDVTGHGAGPAMITSSVAACFTYEGLSERVSSIPEIVTRISSTLLQLTDSKYLMSAVALELDPVTHELRLWNAGAPGVFILRSEGTVEVVGKPSSAMGFSEFSLEPEVIKIQSKDRIIIPTDGILETLDSQGKRIREKTLIQMMKSGLHLSPEDACLQLIEELDGKRGGSPQDDDLTLVILDII